ncbi:unnamed protein product [Symbiodinium natans]|uniref:NYN domain-containing protein n=1 Tax=Symbiodinium natans TaxID=878477 RepID=A0A812TXV0_9DINO|nr:unnamed protein product [Symbiodinium natans]
MVALHGKSPKAGLAAAAAIALLAHRRGQAPRALLFSLPSPPWRPLGRTELSASARSEARLNKKVALLIDGDHIGPQWFQSVLLAVQAMSGERPNVAVCFGAPHLASSWKSQLAQHGLEFQAVHRRNTTNRPDPNDAAILEAANTIAASDGSICIAIASTDSDFLQYHLQLMKRGISSVALVPYASDEKRCVLSGVPSCRFQVPPSTPEFKEAFEERFQKRYDEEEAQQVFQQVGQALQELGYLSPTQPAFPTARSLAIFFHANNEEDVQLYPWCVAAFLARPLLTAAVRNPGDLFFFEAMEGRKQPAALKRWRVERAREGLALAVLAWLGYEVEDVVRPEQPMSLWEELRAFWRRNSKALRINLKHAERVAPSIAILGNEADCAEKLSFLDEMFRDDTVRQQWRPPPNDRDTRLWLARQGYLQDAAAARCEVLEAMRALLRDRGIEPPKHSFTLTLCLAQEAVLRRSDPLSRS